MISDYDQYVKDQLKLKSLLKQERYLQTLQRSKEIGIQAKMRKYAIINRELYKKELVCR